MRPWRESCRKPRKTGKEIGDRRLIENIRLQAADVDMDGMSIDSERRAVEGKLTDDHLAGANEMSDLDDGRMAERCRERQVQFVEGAHALIAGDCGDAARAQLILQQDGRGFSEPLHARLVPRVLEGDYEDTVADDWLRRGDSRRAQHRDDDRDRHHKKVAGTFPGKVAGTFSSLFVRHAAAAGSSALTPLTTTERRQPFPPPAARHSLTRASARSSNCRSTRAIAEA